MVAPSRRRSSSRRAATSARRIAQTYERWGKGAHPAALNFGDCFADEMAKAHGCRLLYVGADFGKTDIEGIP
jgi:ribonuclease VapC